MKSTFGAWVLSQRFLGSPFDKLAKLAQRHPSFPLDGDPGEVRSVLELDILDNETVALIDDAERRWLSC